MKKTFLTILALGFIFTLEAQIDTRLNGRWFLHSDIPIMNVEYYFNNGNFETSGLEDPQSRGTYTTSNGTITLNTTHHFGSMYDLSFDILRITRPDLQNLERRWYTVEETKTIFNGLGLYELENLENMVTFTYTVGSNTLTLIHEEEFYGETLRLEVILQRR